MEQINRNVEAIVEMLQNHPSVQQVFHPSIKDHLNHDICRRSSKWSYRRGCF